MYLIVIMILCANLFNFTFLFKNVTFLRRKGKINRNEKKHYMANSKKKKKDTSPTIIPYNLPIDLPLCTQTTHSTTLFRSGYTPLNKNKHSALRIVWPCIFHKHDRCFTCLLILYGVTAAGCPVRSAFPGHRIVSCLFYILTFL